MSAPSSPVVPSVGAVPVEVPEEAVVVAACAYAELGYPDGAVAECSDADLAAARHVLAAAYPLIAARVRAEGKAERDAELSRWIDVGQRLTEEKRLAEAERDEYHRNWQAAEQALTRVRAEERQRIEVALRVLHPVTTGDRGEPVCATCVNLGEPDSWPCVTLLSLAAGSAVPVATPLPVEVASLPLDELPDWTELAEAVGATLHNSEIGCSGEYETTMRWPDGRAAGNCDRLAIISADSELPSIAEQAAAYRQVEAEYAAERATRIPVATPTDPVDEVVCPKCGTTIRARMSDQPAVGVDFTVTVTDRAGRTVFIGAVDVARGDEYLVIDRAKDQPATLRCVASDLTAQLPAEQDGQR